jgi:hypothetical protein
MMRKIDFADSHVAPSETARDINHRIMLKSDPQVPGHFVCNSGSLLWTSAQYGIDNHKPVKQQAVGGRGCR